MTADTLFLVNPASGKRHNPDTIRAEILAMYAEAGRDVLVQPIDFTRLSETLNTAESSGIQRVFAVGGDGTVNGVGQQMIGRKMAFGVIPTGSGNGYARNIGFSVRTPLAIRQSLDTKIISVDTGYLNDVPFLNVAGIGAEADVLQIFAKMHRRGFLPYLKGSLQTLLNMRTFSCRIEIDGQVLFREEVVSVVAANGAQWGYDVHITPQARLTDGYLNVLVVRKFPVVEAVTMVPKMLLGDLAQARYVEAFQARYVRVETDGTPNAQVDGEFVTGTNPMEIQVYPASLQLLVPATLTDARLAQL